MKQIWLKITSHDNHFLDFYGPLAHKLGDMGPVYTPYPSIPPNARMALPAITEVLVLVTSRGVLDAIAQITHQYFERFENAELTFAGAQGRLRITRDNIGALSTLLDEFLEKSDSDE